MKPEVRASILRWLLYYGCLTGLGLMVAPYIPKAILVAMGIIYIVILLVTLFVRNVWIAKSLGLLCAFMTGIGLYAILTKALGQLGGDIVFLVLGTAVFIFIVAGLVGFRTKKNLGGWGKYLGLGLLAVIIFSIIAVFTGVTDMLTLFVSGLTLLIFMGYTIYDFNQIVQDPPELEEAPMVALNLYLDFVNIFIELLKIAMAISNLTGNDDD